MRLLNSPGKLPLYSEIGLLILLAWMVSGWLLPNQNSRLPGIASDAALPVATLPDLSALVAVPLFGEAPARTGQAKPVVKAAPVVQSALTLKLLGTAVAGEASSAVIALSAGSEQRVFYLGDTIQPGVTLHAVEPWAIVVERAGVREKISMEMSAKPEGMAAPVPVQALAPVEEDIPAVALPVAVQQQVLQRQMDQRQMQEQLDDLPALLSQARVVPNYTDGRQDGFVVSEIAAGSIYQQAGLQNGDVILKVNGRQVSSAEQAMSLYQELKEAAAVDLELMRAGQVQQVHYDLR